MSLFFFAVLTVIHVVGAVGISQNRGQRHLIRSEVGEGKVSTAAVHDTSFLQVQREAVPECRYINLARRTDRQVRLLGELAKADLKCQRLDAVDMHEENITAFEASRRSHLKALAEIAASDAPHGLVLEDDVVWHQPISVVNDILSRVNLSISKHPVILLSCNGRGTATDEPWMLAVQDCQTASAYIIRKDYIPTLVKLMETETTETFPLDQAWKRLQVKDNWGLTQPKLMVQGASFSDIENRPVDYGVLSRLNGSNDIFNPN